MYFDLLKSKDDWNFYADSKYACKLSKSKRCYMARGKMLGGSSSINGMIYVRGSASTYNQWASMGCPGWDYESVLPYFKKFEGNQDAAFVSDDNGRYHNANGPVKVNFGGVSPLTETFIAAIKSSGVEFVRDINNNDRFGHVLLQTNAVNGRRYSTAEAYLAPAKDRPNLHVIKHAYAKKILFGENNKAVGVKLKYKGKHTMEVFARKEVIVSAGAIQSPPLLLRSGIGPRDYLEEHGIHCRADLPVGYDFIDHVYLQMFFKLNISLSPIPPTATFDNLYQYVTSKTGAFGPSSTLSAFLDTKQTNYFNATPFKDGSIDMQLFYNILPRGSVGDVKNFNKFSDHVELNKLTQNSIKQSDLIGLTLSLVKPLSRGVIRMNKSKHQDSTIYSHYLDDPRDRATLLKAIKNQLSLMNSPALKQLGCEFLRPQLSECDELDFESDAYWICYMKYLSSVGTHEAGTSKMGSDDTAVVDPLLRVRHVKGLRQIDMGV